MICGRGLVSAGLLAAALLFASPARGQPLPQADQACRMLVYQFQPVRYGDDHELRLDNGIPQLGVFEEMGPQAAVWIQTAPPSALPQQRRASFVRDVFVTSRTGVFGLGNRPGNGAFVSSPLFPYGNRDNVLPVWAWTRNREYPLLVMQDTYDDSFGFHEFHSTPETFYCRPLEKRETVDALTCPTPNGFNSDKGRFEPGGRKVLYPPRADVQPSECRVRGSSCASNCNDDVACPMLMMMNDVAAISGATPSPYAADPPGLWMVPSDVPDGDYWVFLEVNKEYDQDAPECPSGLDGDCPSWAPTCDRASHFCSRHPSFYDSRLPNYGIGSNIGQPSVVWATQIHIDSVATTTAIADEYVGYGDWDRPNGNLFPPDNSISHTPGSGAARIAQTSDNDGVWRFKVQARPCGACDLAQAPAQISDLTAEAPEGDRIILRFTHVGVGGQPALGYQIKYRRGNTMSDADFAAALPGPVMAPAAPGNAALVELGQQQGIRAEHDYVIGVRAVGECMKATPLKTVAVRTPRQKFTTIEGCFVATAAYGSDLEPEVATLRRFRDRYLMGNPIGRAATSLYYTAGPVMASVIAGREPLRAAARSALRPAVTMARATLLLP